MFDLIQWKKEVSDLREKVLQALCITPDQTEPAEQIRVVFAGQYSAGKSTILKTLTGNEEIRIGAGITTDAVQSYHWNGLEIIDTPGIQTGIRPDHDALSYQAIAEADLLVFVVTNELFDQHMAEHFRKLAIDHKAAGKMILIVNKMSRTALGNVPEQQEIIRNGLQEVLAPYSPEDLYLTFLDAESCLKAAEQSNPALQKYYRDRSGFDQFEANLNRFVTEKRVTGKLTTELHTYLKWLEDEAAQCLSNDEQEIMDLEECLLEQKNRIEDRRRNLLQTVTELYAAAASEIRALGNSAADLLEENCEKDVVEGNLTSLIQTAKTICKECESQVDTTVTSALQTLELEIETLNMGTFELTLDEKLEGKFNTLPDHVKKILNASSEGLQKAGKTVANAAVKTGSRGTKLSDYSGTPLHKAVLKIGKMLGKKFDAWEAVKITRVLGVAGSVFGALGVGLSVFDEINDEKERYQKAIALRTNRRNLRQQFDSAANDLENHGKEYQHKNISEPLDQPICELIAQISEIRSARTKDRERFEYLQALQRKCLALIDRIQTKE